MAATTPKVRKRIYAGLYLRTIAEICSRGWGMKKLTSASEAETERPWAGLAEWLRLAHSTLDEKTVELPRNSD
jgi:hypothetical protein